MHKDKEEESSRVGMLLGPFITLKIGLDIKQDDIKNLKVYDNVRLKSYIS